MDQYDSQRPHGGRRHAQDATPIYDRLLAEWRAARGGAQPVPTGRQARPRAGCRVPAARTPEKPPTGGL
ncbi:hypothetical protein ACF1BP_01890 [Streptomyces sp. NPDC014735]|uniref:hypothetical protein n=1 Tax=unclassified Streptomyces TaxID=2593676 RepID=UPI00369E4023